MTMTNPDEVVTKQDLHDFYEQIKPYLGSYPIAIANKFSKGDIYSTTEKVVGCWTDGKPLYQKTINFGSMPNATSKTVAHGISNLSKVVDIQSVFDNGTYFMLNNNVQPTAGSETTVTQVLDTTNLFSQIYLDKTNITIKTKTDRSGYTCYVTIKYTKTTDSSTPMGDENDYSTSEKIVGTWIDGKPIYQKTFQPSMPQCATNGTGVSGNFSIGATVNEIIKISIKFRSGSGYDMTQESFREGGDGILTSTSSLPTTIYYKGVRCYGAPNNVSTSSDRNKIFLINSSIDMNTYTPVVTVQYTKTT